MEVFRYMRQSGFGPVKNADEDVKIGKYTVPAGVIKIFKSSSVQIIIIIISENISCGKCVEGRHLSQRRLHDERREALEEPQELQAGEVPQRERYFGRQSDAGKLKFLQLRKLISYNDSRQLKAWKVFFFFLW